MPSEQIPTPKQVAQNEAAKQAVVLVASALSIALAMAIMHPDSMRTARMRLAEGSRKLLAVLSRQAGLIAMTIELTTGLEAYEVPFHLSLLRDMAHRKYKRDSDAGPRD